MNLKEEASGNFVFSSIERAKYFTLSRCVDKKRVLENNTILLQKVLKTVLLSIFFSSKMSVSGEKKVIISWHLSSEKKKLIILSHFPDSFPFILHNFYFCFFDASSSYSNYAKWMREVFRQVFLPEFCFLIESNF